MPAKNLGRIQGYIDKILGPDIRFETVEGDQNELHCFAGLGLCLEDIKFALQRFCIGFVDREQLGVEFVLA